jgi:hypothetical protein
LTNTVIIEDHFLETKADRRRRNRKAISRTAPVDGTALRKSDLHECGPLRSTVTDLEIANCDIQSVGQDAGRSFLLPEHGPYPNFARLTAQEEKHGLLDDPSTIGTRDGWAARLNERGFVLKGHRLFRCTSSSYNVARRRNNQQHEVEVE